LGELQKLLRSLIHILSGLCYFIANLFYGGLMMIQLQPHDWYWATWRNLTPLPLPEVRPFDHAALCHQISKLKNSWYWWSSEIAKLPPRISPEEAYLWIKAIELSAASSYQTSPQRLVAEHLAGMEFNQKLSLPDFTNIFSPTNVLYYAPPEIMVVVASALSLTDLTRFLIDSAFIHHSYIFVEGFHQYIVPYLTPDEREQIRNLLRQSLAITPFQQGYYGVSLVYYLAAAVGGFSREIEAELNQLPANAYRHYSYYYYSSSILEVIYGLDNPQAVERYTRHLGAHLFRHQQVAGWLAHTETSALDWVQASIERQKRDEAEKLFKVLTLVEDPAVVPVMISLQKSVVGTHASKWLTEHKNLAAQGAAQMMLNGGQGSGIGRDYLRGMKRKENHAELQAVYDTLEPEQQTRFKAEILDYVEDIPPAFTAENTPDWLKQAIETVPTGRKAKLPDWVDITELPSISVEGASLNLEQGRALLLALSKSTLEAPQPLVSAIKQRVPTPILDRFAWELFDLWQNRGAPSKEKWAMNALGLLGGDDTALRLTPYIRKWPGEAQHQRAVNGLKCLRAINSDTALMQINSIAQKAQHGGIKREARKAIEDIAKARSLTKDQLDDRIVPDCGLDEDGRRVFDFGARKFTFVLNGDLKPQIRDEAGKVKSDLPKPTQKDDAQLAEQSLLEWKLIKKQVREVAKVQSQRLESALVSRRRWALDEFENFIVNHPLMIHLARRLLWAGYNGDRNPMLTFRITDEKDYANAEDDTITLEGVSSIGLVHPLHLNPDELAAWNEIFSDYEIVPPFPQLARKVYKLQPEEMDATEITRFAEVEIEERTLLGILQRLGWMRGSAMDGGVVHGHFKPFYDEKITAFIEYDPGMVIGGYGALGDQKIKSCYFLDGVHSDIGYHDDRKVALKLGKIDVIVMSEILRDLSVIAYRGEK
jgi:hypothetical protein